MLLMRGVFFTSADNKYSPSLSANKYTMHTYLSLHLLSPELSVLAGSLESGDPVSPAPVSGATLMPNMLSARSGSSVREMMKGKGRELMQCRLLGGGPELQHHAVCRHSK